MKQFKFVFILFLLSFSPSKIKAQLNTKVLMTLTGGFGKLNGTSTQKDYSPITYILNEQRKNVPFSLNFHFNSIGNKRVNFGAYGTFMAGAGSSKEKYTSKGRTTYAGNIYPAIAVKLGPQLNYINKDTNFVIGIRYFNWYMDDGLRSPASIDDDGAAIGVYVANKQYGLDINFAPKNLPGILVYNDCNLLQIEFRYKFKKNLKNPKISRIVGLRYEYSTYVLKESSAPIFSVVKSEAQTQFIGLMYGFSFNR